MKELLLEILIILVAVWLLYGRETIIAVMLVFLCSVPAVLITVLILNAYMKNRRTR